MVTINALFSNVLGQPALQMAEVVQQCSDDQVVGGIVPFSQGGGLQGVLQL